MDALIVGKKYYCSDLSFEKADLYKNNKEKGALNTWNGHRFVDHNNKLISWDYWVLAEEEASQPQAVTFPYTPGKKYLFRNEWTIAKGYSARIYVCTIGGRHYSVRTGQESEYPNGRFETYPWDNVIEVDDVTEMTMEQVASVLREQGVITGNLKIKESK